MREIVFDTASRAFTMVDTLRCNGAHEVCRLWHFAEGLDPRLDGDGNIELYVGAFRVSIVTGEQVRGSRLIKGGDASEGGWISRRFGHKRPTATVMWETAIQGTTQLRTYIRISKAEC